MDQINGDTVVAVGSQAGCSSPQNETTIVVNPSNPQNLVGGANDYRVFNSRENRNDSSGWAYASFDGGATWTDVQLPHLTFQTGATGALSDMDSAGEPSLYLAPTTRLLRQSGLQPSEQCQWDRGQHLPGWRPDVE